MIHIIFGHFRFCLDFKTAKLQLSSSEQSTQQSSLVSN